MTPKVSVIVPVYNVEPYLPRCLDSLCYQTLQDIEIIAVNDGSTDGSGSVLNQYASRDRRIRVISQANQGLSAARNVGLDLAHAKFIAFIDSDDYINLHMFETLVSIAERDEADIVQCGMRRINEEGKVFKATQMIPPITFEKILYGGINRSACNKLYLRDIFDTHAIRFPVGLYHEDLSVTCQLYYYARKISWTNQHLYYWYSRSHSIWQSVTAKHVRDMFANFESLAKFLEAQEIISAYEPAFVRGCFYYAGLLLNKIENSTSVNPANNLQLRSLFFTELNRFHYTSSGKQSWLKRYDPRLYFANFYGSSMSENLFDKSKEELIQELKQARTELYMQQYGVDDYQTHVNQTFNIRFNLLFKCINGYQKSHQRIAIYGHGQLGQYLIQILSEKLVVVADQAADTIRGKGYTLCLPEALTNYDFDGLIITVLGQETEISRYLKEVIGIPEEKILKLDLVNGPTH